MRLLSALVAGLVVALLMMAVAYRTLMPAVVDQGRTPTVTVGRVVS